MADDKQTETLEDQLEKLMSEGLEEVESEDKIPFNEGTITSYEEISTPHAKEFDQGVFEASVYIGQFAALINSGMDSDTAIVVMSWIREDKLNKDNITMQVEIAKQEGIKAKREAI